MSNEFNQEEKSPYTHKGECGKCGMEYNLTENSQWSLRKDRRRYFRPGSTANVEAVRCVNCMAVISETWKPKL